MLHLGPLQSTNRNALNGCAAMVEADEKSVWRVRCPVCPSSVFVVRWCRQMRV